MVCKVYYEDWDFIWDGLTLLKMQYYYNCAMLFIIVAWRPSIGVIENSTTTDSVFYWAVNG